MKTSATNRFEGTVRTVREGAIDEGVTLAVGATAVGLVELASGTPVTAIFEASNVVIGVRNG